MDGLSQSLRLTVYREKFINLGVLIGRLPVRRTHSVQPRPGVVVFAGFFKKAGAHLYKTFANGAVQGELREGHVLTECFVEINSTKLLTEKSRLEYYKIGNTTIVNGIKIIVDFKIDEIGESVKAINIKFRNVTSSFG